MTERPAFVGQKEYFPGTGKIPFEGEASDNPYAFKAYEADRIVAGKRMEDWLRFSVCYWHTFTAGGSDPFGTDTREFPWDAGTDQMVRARSDSMLHLNLSPSSAFPISVFMIVISHPRETRLRKVKSSFPHGRVG